jgi:hypothetical protein
MSAPRSPRDTSPGRPDLPRFVIHIGPHKTGTTYIQVALGALHRTLLANQVLFPLHWRQSESQPSHTRLCERLQRKDASLRAEFDEIAAGGTRLVLLSCENFSDLPEDSLKYFRMLIGEHRVQVIFYVRRWSDILFSSWQEVTKHGSTQTLPDFLGGTIMNPAATQSINIALYLERFERTFGISNLRLVSYSNLVDSHADIFRHFLATFVGLPELPHIRTDWANISADMYKTEIIRSLNAVERLETGAAKGRVGFAYLSRSDELEKPELKAAMARSISEIIFDDDTPALRALHEQLFVRYASCLVDPRLAHRLFVPKRRGLQFINQDYLLLPEAVNALRVLYRTLAL